MNGHEERRLTGREAQELLRERAANLRAVVGRERAVRRERREFLWILSAGVAGVAAVFGVAVYSSTRSSEPPLPHHFMEWCVGDCSRADDVWFNPAYSKNMLDVNRVLHDRWQIGRHTYATRDLMGRRI